MTIDNGMMIGGLASDFGAGCECCDECGASLDDCLCPRCESCGDHLGDCDCEPEADDADEFSAMMDAHEAANRAAAECVAAASALADTVEQTLANVREIAKLLGR